MVWVLTRGHGYGRDAIVRVVTQLLASKDFLLEDEELLRLALPSYEHSNLDFPDALMSKVNLAHGCEATATFDRRAARAKGFVSVP